MFVPTKINELTLIRQKSRFIAIVIPIINVKNLDIELAKIEKQYPKASHYLYAYKIGQIMKCNNDQEPGNIAQTFLTLINQYQLDNVLVIVVRYFGGIKLGASNLLRTYREVVNELFKKTSFGKITLVYQYHLECDYATFNKIKQLGFSIENVNYFDTIEMNIISQTDILSSLKHLKVKKLQVEKIKRVINER